MRVARAARLFFLTRPIKFSICGVVVTFPVVDAKTLYYHCVTEIACLPTVASVDVFHSITEGLLLCMQFQRCIQSASLRPGTHSFFFWTQRILNEGSNWTQKKKIECLCKLQTPGKNSVTRCANLFHENSFYQLVDSSVTVYFAVNFQTKVEKPLCFLITFLSR